jgi:hypothetical protein
VVFPAPDGRSGTEGSLRDVEGQVTQDLGSHAVTQPTFSKWIKGPFLSRQDFVSGNRAAQSPGMVNAELNPCPEPAGIRGLFAKR